MKIYNFSEYNKKIEELNDLRDYRDKVEEHGGDTTNLDNDIEEIEVAVGNFRKENNEL